MSVGNWITGSIAAVLIVVLFGALAVGAAGIVRTVRLGAPDGSRGGPLGGRLTAMLTEIVGHTRMLKWGLIGVRQRNHPRRPGRRSRFAGSNFAQAYFVEVVILTIAICIFAIRGFKAANGWLPYPAWAAPISTGLGKILPAWPAAIV